VTEHERESKRVKQQSTQARVDDALHQHVDRFARPAEPGFEHRKADLHAEYEKRGEKHPHRVDRIYNIVSLDYGIVGVRRTSHYARDKSEDYEEQQDCDQLSAEQR